MSWLQIKIPVLPEQAEFLEDILLELGACALTLTDAQDTPVFEPIRGTTPLWQDTLLTGLYDGHADVDRMLIALQQQWQQAFPAAQALPVKVEILEDKDWVREWMASFQPLCMGQRLWIVPSWLSAPQTDAVNLTLDPGLAFGTGTHPTTALCLQWLDSMDLTDATVIDYGCGSGILGIAALLLGARQAWGTDIDPQALQASQENARRNHLDPARFPVYYPHACPQVEVDIVLANILAGPLIDLAPQIAAYVKPQGHLVLSGILQHQAHAVIQAYQTWFDFEPPAIQEDWVRLCARKTR